MINALINRFLQLVSNDHADVLQSVLDMLGGIVVITDDQGYVVSLFGDHQRFFQQPAQAIIGQPVVQMIPLLDEFFDRIDREEDVLCDRLMVNAAGERIIVDLNIKRFSSGRSSGWAFLVDEKNDEAYQRHVYHRILEPINHETGDKFFEALLKHLRHIFGCRYSLVATVDDDLEIATTIAFSENGEPRPNFQYSLSDTPCKNVLNKDSLVITEHVSRQYPKDKLLVDMGIESYFGISLMDSEGTPIGILVAMDTERAEDWPEYRDFLQVFSARCSAELSRHKATQAMEQAVEQKERAIRSKELFFANMSHEIRTPLSSILGYVDVLADDQIDSKTRSDSVETIHRSGEHLLSLINDILDLSKLESGKLKLDCISFSPVDVIEQAVRMMKSKAESKDLSLNITLSEESIPEITSDPTRLRQVLINLISNSIKFLDDGGRIDVSCHIREEYENSMICISVVDDGYGFNDETQQRVFEAFGQDDSSITRNFGGTGLSLAVSQRLVELLGGEIDVRSELGRGTQFRVQLPINSNEQHEGKVPHPKIVPASKSETIEKPSHTPRVLIAEDHLDNLKLFGHILNAAGFEVVMVENGEEACRAVSEATEDGNPFDAVLMDMRMPVLDGYEATSLLRETEHELPIIAVTAYAMIGDREKCLNAGCSDFLAKPFDRRELIGMVRSHVDGTKNTGVV